MKHLYFIADKYKRSPRSEREEQLAKVHTKEVQNKRVMVLFV